MIMNLIYQLLALISGCISSLASFVGEHDDTAPTHVAQTGAEAKPFTGLALPNAVDTPGDAVRIAANEYGVLYNLLVIPDGSKTPLGVDEQGGGAAPAFIKMGAVYSLALPTYNDGDEAKLHTTENGLLRVDISTLGNNNDISLGAGNVEPGTQRTTLADDDPAVVALTAILAASGASSQLPVTHWSPIDGSVTFTTDVTLTCSGFPFTVENGTCGVVFVMYKPTAGLWTRLINGTSGVSISASANVITVTGAGTPFASGDTYIVGLSYQQKGFIAANNALRSEQINDTQLKFGFDQLSVTNMTSGTYYFPVDMEGFNFVTFQIIGSGVVPTDTLTLTLECSVQNDGTAMLSCQYRDRTSELLGIVSLVDPVSEWWELWGIGSKWVRIKYVAAGGSNDSDLTIFVVKGQI